MNTSNPRMATIALFVSLLTVITSSSFAQSTYFWRTESTSGNWQSGTGTQWWLNGGTATGFAFGIQWWDNNNFLTQTNTTASAATHAFQFRAGASDVHTFVGSSVRLFDFGGANPYIRNLSAVTHVFNFAIEGDGTEALELRMDATGGLRFNGNITNNGSTVNVVGTNTTDAKQVRFDGIISGAGGFFMDNSAVTALFNNANTMSGQMTLSNGIARLTNSGTFGSSSQNIRLSAGGTLDLNGVSTTVGSVAERGVNDGGSINLGAGTLTVTANDTNIFQNSISGTGGLTKQGSHTLTLYGTQSYTGTTTVAAGRLATTAALASQSYNLTGGTFALGGDNLMSTANDVAVTLGGGTLRLDATNTARSQVLNGPVSLTASTTSRISPSGADAGTTITVNGIVSGSGNLIKEGGGRLVMSADNSYTGTTEATLGILQIDGNQSSADGNVTIGANATLAGSGTIGGATTISGIHSPGSSTGIQSFANNLTYNAGSSVLWELTANSVANRGDNYDGINLLSTANVNFSGATTMNLTFNAGGSVAWGDSFWANNRQWLVYDLNGGAVQNFGNLSLATLNWADDFGGLFLSARPDASFALTQSEGDIYLAYTVPEPSTYALLGLGAAGLAAHLIRRRRRA